MSFLKPLHMSSGGGHMQELRSLIDKGRWSEADSKDFAELLCDNVLRIFESGQLNRERLLELMNRLQIVIDKGNWVGKVSNYLARLLCEHVIAIVRYGEADPEIALLPERVLINNEGEPAESGLRVSEKGEGQKGVSARKRKHIADDSPACPAKHKKVAGTHRTTQSGEERIRRIIEEKETEGEDLRSIAKDVFKWKKYGKKQKGKYFRYYLACSATGCPAKKWVNRLSDEEVEVILVNHHNCILYHEEETGPSQVQVQPRTSNIQQNTEVANANMRQHNKGEMVISSSDQQCDGGAFSLVTHIPQAPEQASVHAEDGIISDKNFQNLATNTARQQQQQQQQQRQQREIMFSRSLQQRAVLPAVMDSRVHNGFLFSPLANVATSNNNIQQQQQRLGSGAADQYCNQQQRMIPAMPDHDQSLQSPQRVNIPNGQHWTPGCSGDLQEIVMSRCNMPNDDETQGFQ